MTKKSHIYFIDNYNFEKYKQINGIHVLKIKKDKLIANCYLNGAIPFINETNEDLYSEQYFNPISLINTDDPFYFQKLPEYNDEDFGNYIESQKVKYERFDKTLPPFAYGVEYLKELESARIAIKNNDENYLNSMLSIFRYGKLVEVNVLHYNSIVYMNEMNSLRYFDHQDQTFKNINKTGIKKILNADKNYHYIVIMPTHLYMHNFNEENCARIKMTYPDEFKDQFYNELQNFPLGPVIGKLARVIKPYNNKHHSLNQDEIVFVLSHGKYKNSLKLLASTGEIKYANKTDLVCLPQKQQDPQISINYQIQRKRLQYQEQESGFPLLLIIDEINEMSISGTTPAGDIVWIPRSIIPKLPVINKDRAAWIWIPLWYHEKISK